MHDYITTITMQEYFPKTSIFLIFVTAPFNEKEVRSYF